MLVLQAVLQREFRRAIPYLLPPTIFQSLTVIGGSFRLISTMITCFTVESGVSSQPRASIASLSEGSEKPVSRTRVISLMVKFHLVGVKELSSCFTQLLSALPTPLISSSRPIARTSLYIRQVNIEEIRFWFCSGDGATLAISVFVVELYLQRIHLVSGCSSLI